MQRLNRDWLKPSLLFAIVPVILYLSYWHFISYTPLGWKHYKNMTTRHHYSFAYPKDWILTECGNGEVVVAKETLERCYRPLEAPKEYIDTVYFQVFIPENHYEIGSREITLPENLHDWTTMFFYWDEEAAIINSVLPIKINEYSKISGTILPINPIDTDIYVKYSESNRRNKYVEKTEPRVLVGQLTWFMIGFYHHKELMNEFKSVKNSFHYNYK